MPISATSGDLWAGANRPVSTEGLHRHSALIVEIREILANLAWSKPPGAHLDINTNEHEVLCYVSTGRNVITALQAAPVLKSSPIQVIIGQIAGWFFHFSRANWYIAARTAQKRSTSPSQTYCPPPPHPRRANQHAACLERQRRTLQVQLQHRATDMRLAQGEGSSSLFCGGAWYA